MYYFDTDGIRMTHRLCDMVIVYQFGQSVERHPVTHKLADFVIDCRWFLQYYNLLSIRLLA